MQVWLQPLCVLHRPACLDRVAAFGDAMPHDTQGSRLMSAINGLNSPAARMLAKARLQEGAPAPADLYVQVRPHSTQGAWAPPVKKHCSRTIKLFRTNEFNIFCVSLLIN